MSDLRRYPHAPPPGAPHWWETEHCSACHHPIDLRPDEAAAGAFVFCDDCLQRSREITEWDDLGVAD